MPHRSGDHQGAERRRTPRVSCRLHGRIVRRRERLRVRIVDVSEGGLCLLSPAWLNPKQTVELQIDVPGRGTARVQIEVWHIRREKSRTTADKIWVAGAILRDADEAYGELLEAAGLAPGLTSRTRRSMRATGGSGVITAATKALPGPTPIPSPAATSTRSQTPAPPAASPRARAVPSSLTLTPKRPPAAGSAPASRPGRPSVRPAAPATEDANDALDGVEPRVFRLHCKARGSPRTRVLTLAADSAEQARKLAEVDLGAAWDLLEVREV